MTKQTPDPAAGASRWEAPAAGSSRPANDLAAAAEQLLSGGSQHLDSAALRDALLDLHEFWLTTKATEIGITATSGFAIVATGGLGRGELLPYSDLDLMLVHDNMPARRRQRRSPSCCGTRCGTPTFALDHSVRTVPEALQGRRRGHLGGPGHARGAAHRRRRRPVGTADRRCASAVAHRNRLALRRTRRAHPGALAAQRSDRAPRRARPEERPRRTARRPAAQRAGDRPTGRRVSQPVAGIADRNARRRASGAAQRAHRTAPGLAAAAASCCWPSTPTRSAPRCASATDSTWRACSPTPRAPSATTSTPACAPRRMRCRAAGFAALRRPVRRPLDEGVIEFGGEVILARDARPERDPGLILRVAAASATTGLPMSASTLSRLAETAPELRTPWPRQALKDLLVMLAAGPPTVATIEALDRTGLVGQAVSGMGRGARPSAARRRAHLDRRPPSRRNRLAGKRIHHPGVAARSAGARRAVPRHRQGPRRRPQRHRRRTGHPDRHPAGAVAVGHRDAVQDRALPPAAAATPRPAGTCRTRRRSRRSSTRSTATRCCSSCCTCWPRPIRWPPAPGCGATGRRR